MWRCGTTMLLACPGTRNATIMGCRWCMEYSGLSLPGLMWEGSPCGRAVHAEAAGGRQQSWQPSCWLTWCMGSWVGGRWRTKLVALRAHEWTGSVAITNHPSISLPLVLLAEVAAVTAVATHGLSSTRWMHSHHLMSLLITTGLDERQSRIAQNPTGPLTHHPGITRSRALASP